MHAYKHQPSAVQTRFLVYYTLAKAQHQGTLAKQFLSLVYLFNLHTTYNNKAALEVPRHAISNGGVSTASNDAMQSYSHTVTACCVTVPALSAK
jgi:hypothetical protein